MLDLLRVGILNIKLGPFNTDSHAVSLAEQLFAPDIIFQRINVSYTLDPQDLVCSYFYTDTIVVWRAWVICQSALSHMILAACLFGTIGISICHLPLFTDCHKVCSFLEGAFAIKIGLFAGVTQTDIDIPPDFETILCVALLVTNAVATLMILHKTWYYICLSVACKS